MANNSEFYRGKRKKTAPALIATIIILAVIAFVVMLFYGLQKYIVVTNSGLHLEIPFLEDGSGQTEQTDDGQIVVQSFEPVEAQLEIGQADYSNVKATAGEDLSAVKLVYVPASSVTTSGVASYLSKSPDATGVLLDVKTVTGMLVWESQADIAKGYGTTGTVDLASIVSSLKEQGKYVAVRMCCFVDNTLASRYTQLALKTTDGQAYSDSNGAWLDPTNATVKSYISSLCSELSKMGVDEIVLLGMRLPEVSGVEFSYSSSSAVKPTPLTAVSGFGISVTRAMRSASARMSVQLTSSAAMKSGGDTTTGQSAEILFKVFDRVYYTSESSAAADLVSSCSELIELGDVKMRVVPICSTAPSTECWVLME